MEPEKIKRINALAAKARTPEGLTEAELAERQALRAEYIASFRASMQAHLDNMYYLDENGNEQKIKPRSERMH